MNSKININGFDEKLSELKDYISEYITKNTINEDILYYKICDCLSWLEMVDKQKNEKNLSEEEKKKLSGARYVMNLKKHEKKLVDFKIKTKALYPSENLFPSEKLYPSENNVYWAKIKFNEQNLNQYRNYCKYLEGKELLSTLNELRDILYNNIYNIVR